MLIKKERKGISLLNKFVFDGNGDKDKKVFISHAHDDHLPSKPTYALASEITKQVTNLRKKRTLILDGKEESWNTEKYKLYDAGHVPGSKMIELKIDEKRVLYTGDFSLHSNPLVKVDVPSNKIDILIIDATYFSPYYSLPEPKDVIVDIIDFIYRNKGPIYFFAYPYGKSQILASYFDKYGLEYSFLDIFRDLNNAIERQLGYKFKGDYKPLEIIKRMKGVAILPLSYKRYITRGIKVGVSGWGKNPYYARRFGFDIVFPYSDHADFDDLIKFIERLNPDIVYGFQLNGNKDFFEKYIREEYGVFAQGL